MGWLTLCCWRLSGILEAGKAVSRVGCSRCSLAMGLGKPCSLLAVFIYSMPGYKCSIKERMLYSSCKSRLLDTVEQEFCLEIAKKVSASPPRGDGAGHCCAAALVQPLW